MTASRHIEATTMTATSISFRTFLGWAAMTALAITAATLSVVAQAEPIRSTTKLAFSDATALVNMSRAAYLIPSSALADDATKPGLRGPIKWPTEPLAGVKAIMTPLSAVAQLDNLNEDLLLALRREDASGHMQLVSIPTGAYLRVSDCVNEYDFADFQYGPDDGFHEYHKRFHALEAHPELAR